jgi:hypothetical protein
MKVIKCDKCGVEYNPFSEGGMTLTLSDQGGVVSFDLCQRHAQILVGSLEKFLNLQIQQPVKKEDNQLELPYE